MTTQCTQDHVTTQTQAVAYMNNEIIWAQLIVLAWQNATVMSQLQGTTTNDPSAPTYSNTVLTNIAQQYLNLTPTIPAGTTMKIIFDSDTTKHLLLPVVPNTPPGPLMMVPHGL